MTEVDEVTLRKALQRLVDLFDDDPKTWVKGASRGWRNENGRLAHRPHEKTPFNCWCVTGGVEKVTKHPHIRIAMMQELYESLPPHWKRQPVPNAVLGSDWYHLQRYNDDPNRRFVHIKHLCERALARVS